MAPETGHMLLHNCEFTLTIQEAMGFNPTNKPLFEAVVQQGFESETPRLPV